MLKGVSGLLELAGGGRWSSGLRLLLSAASHLPTSLDVIAGRSEELTLFVVVVFFFFCRLDEKTSRREEGGEIKIPSAEKATEKERSHNSSEL